MDWLTLSVLMSALFY